MVIKNVGKYRRLNRKRMIAYVPKRTFRRHKRTKVVRMGAKTIQAVSLNLPVQRLSVAPAGSTGNNLQYVFGESLSNVQSNDLTAYTNLYDEFKITGFTYQIKPRGNTVYGSQLVDANGDPSYGNQGFQLYHVLDFTDTNSISNVNEALEYQTCKIQSSWKSFKRYVPCCCPQLIHDVNNNPMLITSKPRWMQTATQTIGGTSFDDTITSMIGAKIYSDPNPNLVPVYFDLFVKLNVQFRNKK